MYELKNYTEIMVNNTMNAILSKYPELCKCQKCILDIKALSLNRLRPRYVVTQSGEVYKKIDELDRQYYADTVAAVTEAITIVMKNPQHNIK